MTAIYRGERFVSQVFAQLQTRAYQTYRRDNDEQGLEDLSILSKQVEAEVDEDEVFRQLRHDRKHILGRLLRLDRHGVVGIVLQCYSTEEQGHDTWQRNG